MVVLKWIFLISIVLIGEKKHTKMIDHINNHQTPFICTWKIVLKSFKNESPEMKFTYFHHDCWKK